MGSEDLKRTPLHACHAELGARLVEFAGWEMPVQYAGVIEEHRAVRTAAGLFDVGRTLSQAFGGGGHPFVGEEGGPVRDGPVAHPPHQGPQDPGRPRQPLQHHHQVLERHDRSAEARDRRREAHLQTEQIQIRQTALLLRVIEIQLRPQTTIEGLAKLKPAFGKNGSVTAGNASGIVDGAAAVVTGKLDVREAAASLPDEPPPEIIVDTAAPDDEDVSVRVVTEGDAKLAERLRELLENAL